MEGHMRLLTAIQMTVWQLWSMSSQEQMELVGLAVFKLFGVRGHSAK